MCPTLRPGSGIERERRRGFSSASSGNDLLLARSPWSALAELLDATVYIELDRVTRVGRLVARHVPFGASIDDATAFVRDSDDANTALIEPRRHRADVIVSDPEAVRGGNYR